MDNKLCLTCVYLEMNEVEGYYLLIDSGIKKWIDQHISYFCIKRMAMMRKVRDKCKEYLSVRQSIMKKGDDNMVKVEALPSEGERIDLKDLPKECELLALEEKMVEPQLGKTGGLQIKFKMRDNRVFYQKYTQVSGAVLMRFLDKLGVKDTEELQETWFKYELTAMRIGMPRMIPTKKLEKIKPLGREIK